MAQIIIHFCKDETGATAIEYALIAGFISIVIVAAAQSIGTESEYHFLKRLRLIKIRLD